MFLACVFSILIVSSTILQEHVVSGTATIVKHSSFNPDKDAIAIYKAMKGIGTDEAKIISIATKRSQTQRLEIKEKYQERYDKSIFKDFRGDLGGAFLKLITALFQTTPVFFATATYNAVTSFGTVDDALTGIFCCVPDGMMSKIITAYQTEFNRDMKKDVSDETSGYYSQLLQALMKNKRANSMSFHSNRTNSLVIARKLIKGVGIIYGKKEQPIIKVFSQSSYKELAEVADVYEEFTNKSLEASVKSETSGNFGDLLLQILLYSKNPVSYYVDLLKPILLRSNQGVIHINSEPGDTLSRVLVTRSEVDLKEIAIKYKSITKKSLEDDVKSAFSGDFEKACVSLIQGNAR